MRPRSESEDTCQLCNGTGWKPVQANGVERVTRCDCWRDKNVENMLRRSGIPERYSKCELENFQTSSDTLVRALSAGSHFADNFPIVKKGLLFYGPPGVGKSHLVSAILRRVIKRVGATGLFWESKEFFRTAREGNNPHADLSENDILQPVLNAELLVFDDLGSERMSEWVDETLNLIVNVRYNHNRLSIFATNHPPIEADAKSANQTLEERVGARVLSRLHEMCEFVPMRTVDYRKLGPDASAEEFARLDKKGRSPNEVGLPARAKHQARAQLRRGIADAELKWPGGRAGNK
ncbi:MAG: ATP-binding protein [Vicinamibacterales bacterium]|nr:ATP-binding protein [Vicinamibacterales bacterium]